MCNHMSVVVHLMLLEGISLYDYFLLAARPGRLVCHFRSRDSGVTELREGITTHTAMIR